MNAVAVQGWISTVCTIVIACGVIYNAWRTRQLEKNTNGIKDALVASTAKASHLEGREAIRNEISQAISESSPVKSDPPTPERTEP